MDVRMVKVKGFKIIDIHDLGRPRIDITVKNLEVYYEIIFRTVFAFR